MANTWGHYLRPAEPDELAQRDRDVQWAEENASDDQVALRPWLAGYRARAGRCKVRNCDRLWTHFHGYQYVTGRAGRVSIQERRVCEAHGLEAVRKAESKAVTR